MFFIKKLLNNYIKNNYSSFYDLLSSQIFNIFYSLSPYKTEYRY
jgi:hypothetical protein